jgi:hypothetical protein
VWDIADMLRRAQLSQVSLLRLPLTLKPKRILLSSGQVLVRKRSRR